ncbi:hypothetical protein D9M71_302880 [compost metagenome]
MALPSPFTQFVSQFVLDRGNRLAFGNAQVHRQFQAFVIHPDKGRRGGQRAHERVLEGHAELVAQVVQAPVVGGVAGGVGEVVVLERHLLAQAIDEAEHARHRVDPGFRLRGVSRNASHGEQHLLAVGLGIDAEVATIVLHVLGTSLLQAFGQLYRVVGEQGRHRGGRDLVGGQAAGQVDDLGALAAGLALAEAGHDRAVAFLGDHHGVAAIEGQVVVGRGIALEVVGYGIAAGFFGGVDQQLELAGQRQVFVLGHLQCVHRHDNTVLVVLGATAVHAVADQSDLERVQARAVGQLPVVRVDRHHIGMGMDADHFLAAAQRNLVHPVVDVAEGQAEAVGQGLDLVGDLEELGVLVLRHAFDVEGGDGHQFTQGFTGGLAILDAGVQAEQAVDLVLLLGGQWLAGQVGVEGGREVVDLGQVAAFELAEELLEVAWVAAVEGFDDGRGLLLGEVGLGRLGEQADAGQQQSGGGEFFQMHGCAHSFANHCCGLPVRKTGRRPR